MAEEDFEPRRSPTKNDILIEEVRRKYIFRTAIVSGLTAVFWTIATGLPLYFIYGTVHDLAGKKTEVTLGLVITGILTIPVPTIAATTMWIKCSRQKKELKRLRERCAKLEEKLKLPPGS